MFELLDTVCAYLNGRVGLPALAGGKVGPHLASELSGRYALHYSSSLMIRSTPILRCTKDAMGGALVESDAFASTNGGPCDLGRNQMKSPVRVQQRAWTVTLVYSRSSPRVARAAEDALASTFGVVCTALVDI